MKSRSHRQTISEPRNDDWVNGSWTVDCICGVNFDDGEEMVDCDECGVWVHTRCVRFVKGEKSFSCDKCKNRNSGIGNDSEETEVAEFLVELPTKTLAMDNPSVNQDHRLWTNIPMEERVHVHGVPGGEPGIFSGSKMSSVFGPVLWRCSGYVPKKFSSKYNEFPWCGNGEVEENGDGHSNNKSGEENADHGNDGAGVLLSLSKEEKKNRGVSSVEDSDVAKSPLEGDGLVSLKKLNGEKVNSGCIGDRVNESSSGKPKHTILPSSKRKELSMSKVLTEKKKRISEEEDDGKRLPGHTSNAVLASTFSSDAKQLEFSQARGPTTVNDDVYCSDVLGECATNLALSDRAPEASVGKDISNNEKANTRSKVDRSLMGSGSFTNTDDDSAPLSELTASQCKPVKEEVREDSLHHHHDFGGTAITFVSHDKEPAALDAKENRNGHDLNINEADSGPNKKLKDAIDGDHEGYHKKSLPVHSVKSDSPKAMSQHPKSPADVLSAEGKMIETSVASPEVSQQKMHEGNKNLSVDTSNNYVPHVHTHLPKQTDGLESSMGARKKSSGLKNNSELSESLSKPDSKVSSHSTTGHQGKGVASVGRHTSISSGNASKFHSNHVAGVVRNPSTENKQKELSKSSTGTMKDNSSSYTVNDDEKYERRKKLVKESSRLNPVSKTSSTKSHVSDTNRASSELKDSAINSASKVILAANSTAATGSGDRATVHIDSAANAQNKAGVGSALSGSGEKSHHSANHPAAKGNVASMIAAASSNVPAHLSDEELAFLLHQELNSSPRVPRVPRMRHAGSLPQITSPNASSTLMKRTSSSGNKDISMTSRRRSKDLSRDRSRGLQEADNELKKMERKHLSPENRRRDGGSSVDSLSKRDTDGGGRSMQYKKSSSLSSSGDANGHNLTSRRSSRSTSDYDSRNRHRTLPGLIAEIMSEGKRMTYEELCNAVLPHWPHLRKHNGERYAYSSHSQAVLDCLRNRSEWARLVDRGPKTSASRKRRKNDTDSVSIDSEDTNEHVRAKKSKGSFDSQQEDFTKGKRNKTTKGRRLTLQGRGMVRRRRRADVVSDDESESFSDSSSEEHSMSSEDEIQGGGGGTSTAGNEATSSSDDIQ